MPDISDEEWDRLDKDLAAAAAALDDQAENMVAVIEAFGRAVGEARPAITLEQARQLQRKIRLADGWLRGARLHLDPEWPMSPAKEEGPPGLLDE